MMILFFAAYSPWKHNTGKRPQDTLLLLLTRMTNAGWCSNCWQVCWKSLSLPFFSVPLLMLLALREISYPQIFRSTLVILFGALVFGSVGSLYRALAGKNFSGGRSRIRSPSLAGDPALVGSGLFGSVSATARRMDES